MTYHKVSGELDRFGIVLLNIRIKGQIFTGAIDTGSAGNVMRPDMPAILGLGQEAHGTRGIRVPNEGGSDAPYFDLEYEIIGPGLKFTDTFVVMTDFGYHYQFLIGAEFLLQCKELRIYGRERRFELYI